MEIIQTEDSHIQGEIHSGITNSGITDSGRDSSSTGRAGNRRGRDPTPKNVFLFIFPYIIADAF